MLSRTAYILAKRVTSPPSVSRVAAAAVSAATGSGRSYTTHSQLPEEHQMIHEMCRKFADEELAPSAGKWDKEHAFPTEAVTHLVRFVKDISAR